jgi:ATP-dependent helicase Lhr and Lhr-like helicase
VDTPVPSAFSHEILNANPYAYLDDAPLEERRARAVDMRRVLPESVLQEVGKLDPAAIAQVREEAWPDVRDSEELADVLQTLVALPGDFASPIGSPQENWSSYFQILSDRGRATRASHDGKWYWVSAERLGSFKLLFPSAQLETGIPQVETSLPSSDDALLALVTGWMMHAGPVTTSQLGARLNLPATEIEKAMLRLEAAGTVLRGKFTGTTDELEWCERRLLARIHRLTVGALRKQIEPVTAAQYMRWLFRWQHVAPGTQLTGERGTLEVLRQLQGFEIPANAWEREVLARRVITYDPKVLDQLSLTGVIGWGRLSPHPATLEATNDGRRRVIPTSVAPITFFVREESDWMLPRHPAQSEDTRGLSAIAREVLSFLRTRGASFFADIVRGTSKLKSEIETGLWELVAAGLITADGFDNLRALIDPRRRAGQGGGRSARPRHSLGRWSLLYMDAPQDQNHAVEATCKVLLNRYGVVFREALAREALLPKWRELLMAFRRLEDRGEVRGGRFISGFIGEQFALPMAVESLRALRKQDVAAAHGRDARGTAGETPALPSETVTISAADPLNLVGIVVPGERVPAISGKFVTFRDGVAAELESVEMRAAAM